MLGEHHPYVHTVDESYKGIPTMGTDRYTVISTDTHAGGSHQAYREYLPAEYHEQFDAWRGEHKNPWKDLRERDERRLRNWDNDKRNGEQHADGVVGEVIFPNTIPPFYPSFVLFAGPPRPEEYELRRVGIQTHNRWLADFCAEFPEKRAGIGQVFLNDVDDAIEDATWIAEHGLRGGILLPPFNPGATWVRQLNSPDYDRFWAAIQDLDIPMHSHGGTGTPPYEKHPTSQLVMLTEASFFSRRPFVTMLLSGVFERFPKLKLVLTELGCSWLPGVLDQMDDIITRVRDRGNIGELTFPDEVKLPKLATEYFKQNVHMGVSFPSLADIAVAKELGLDNIMWGSDYPHNEGTFPMTREHLRLIFADMDPADVRKVLTDNAAELFRFDVSAMQHLTDEFGPTYDEVHKPLSELPADANESLKKAWETTRPAA